VTPAELSRTVLATVRRAVMAEELQVDAVPEKIAVQRPSRPGCGHYATNVALQLAGPARRSAGEVAEILARRLAREPGIARVEIAPPGFLNITLNARAYADVVRQVREQREAYGRGDGLAGEAVTMTADPRLLRGPVVAETVNLLLRAAGAQPGPPEPVAVVEPGPNELGLLPAGPQELLAVVEPGPDEVAACAPGTGPAPSAACPSATCPPAAAPSGPSPSDASRSAPARDIAPARSDDPARDAGPAPLDPAARLGRDALRWALLRPPAEDPPRLSADLLRQHESNPLFRVRYAHARTRALLRNAHDLGVDLGDNPPGQGNQIPPAAQTAPPGQGNPARPAAQATPAGEANPHPAETELLGLLADFPRIVETAARRRAPDRVARHLERLADAFLRFHDECPALPKGDEKPSAVHAARVRLADATGIVLADGLLLLGISAPDRL
jgi:arginyl-tRNA synthetase